MHRCCVEQHTRALACKIDKDVHSHSARGEHLVSSEIQNLHVRRSPQFRALPARCWIDTDDSDIVFIVFTIFISQIDRALPFDQSLLLELILKFHLRYFARTHTAHKLSCFFSREILWVAILKRNWRRAAGDESLDLKISCSTINTSRSALENSP